MLRTGERLEVGLKTRQEVVGRIVGRWDVDFQNWWELAPKIGGICEMGG